jgi:hypothetical protein
MLPKTGRKLHRPNNTVHGTRFALIVAGALRAELGETHRSIKTVMRWTGASERTVKHWFAGTHGPSGSHLTALARHSDSVLSEFLLLADRDGVMFAIELSSIRTRLLGLLAILERRST